MIDSRLPMENRGKLSYRCAWVRCMDAEPMQPARHLQCLAADQARLRSVAAHDLTAAVPTCPGWTVADLVAHVAQVYLHKVECMRRGEHPKGWPPDLSGEEPVALLDRAFAELSSEFAVRAPESKSYTWYDPDQTVGFWVRRMAHEAVIHRVDAELAVDQPVTPIPDDLAVDGVDEVLECFLAYATRKWPEDFGETLATAGGSTVLISTGGRQWLVALQPSGVVITRDGSGDGGSAEVTGDPQELLLWLWRRTDPKSVTVRGDAESARRLWALLREATQ
jgi:uncharacterized protein (TIGR03083 family)